MPLTDPPWSLPWPLGTDRVRDGDDTIHALAERVAECLTGLTSRIAAVPSRPLVVAGVAHVTVPGESGTRPPTDVDRVRIAFPPEVAGRPMAVSVTPACSRGAWMAGVLAGTIDASGFTAYVAMAALPPIPAPWEVDVYWSAIEQGTWPHYTGG